MEVKKLNPHSDFEFILRFFDLPMVGLDTETSVGERCDDRDIRDGSGHALGISLAVRIVDVVYSCYLPFRHHRVGDSFGTNLSAGKLAQLKHKIENYQGWIAGFNWKHDEVALQTLGIYYTGKFYDGLKMWHLISEEYPYAFDLNTLCKTWIGREKNKSPELDTYIKAFGWKMVTPNQHDEYASNDAALHLLLVEKALENKEWTPDLQEYWETQKIPFYRVIMKMESRGVRIDQALCRRMTAIGESIMAEDIQMLGGFNPGSGKDLNELLTNRLKIPVQKTSPKTGKPSFDKYAMEEYELILERMDSDIAHYILEYRGWQKAVSSNYRPYVELVSADGRLRPNYKLHGTKTGRMSCEKPNLQQIPRSSEKPWNGEMKSAFIPDPGYTLWEADYAQLELRLATAYAKETGLKEVFSSDRDIFTEMSQELGMVRDDTKTLTYTIQYGGGIKRLVNVFGVSADTARVIRENFFATYPGFRAISNMAQRKVANVGKVALWTKRYRHFVHKTDHAHKAFNSVIQGGAADIVEQAMIRLFNTVDNDDECRMLLQVHDSVLFEIKNGCEAKYMPLIRQVMEDIPQFGVRFKIDIHKWGTKESWEEAA